jgi:hypothetical protein
VRLLARTLLLLALTSGCERSRELNDGGTAGAEACYGAYGVAVLLDPGACGPSAEVRSQMRLSSGGAVHVYDYAGLAAAVSEAWPLDFHDTDPGTVELTAEGEGCSLSLSGSFVVDHGLCVVVHLGAPPP